MFQGYLLMFQIIDKLDEAAVNHPKFWLPLIWAGSIVTRARHENRIANDYASKHLIERLDTYRSMCGGLLNYDWVNVPLVYTQVVTLAVYTFLLSTLLSSQFINPAKAQPDDEPDLYVPVFTFLQFFFYMGWLRVAEALINPFGEDDDDFDMNWFIDRNIQVSYLIVDEMHAEHPELIKDTYWDTAFPELPYTAAANAADNDNPFVGATTNVEVPKEEAEFIPRTEEGKGKDQELNNDGTAKDLEAGNLRSGTSTPSRNTTLQESSFLPGRKMLRRFSLTRQSDDADSMISGVSRRSRAKPLVPWPGRPPESRSSCSSRTDRRPVRRARPLITTGPWRLPTSPWTPCTELIRT